MESRVIIGEQQGGAAVHVDIEELLATRLLVQGNSGSGKSHLLRRLLEESAGIVQQIVIDPEGDFVTLADHFDHVVIDGAGHSVAEIEALAARTRQHRASVVLSLEGLDVEQQIRCAAHFLTALFDAPREHWFPVLVVVDEAQMFAPAAGGEISEETRRISLNAMTNLMCRGRKRGLAGIVATQRLAKLAKNVAAEASNFLMGRTFLDIDMIRAADLLGMERRQAEQIRDLDRGMFLGLGPAITRVPLKVKIGSVQSGPRTSTGSGLLPLPSAAPAEMKDLLHSELAEAAAARGDMPAPPPAAFVMDQPSGSERLAERMAELDAQAAEADAAALPASDAAERVEMVLRDLAADPKAAFQPTSALFQTFLMQCRQYQVQSAGIDMAGFRRRFALAQAGMDRLDEETRAAILQLAAPLEDDLLAPFLLIARLAATGHGTPDEDQLARVYGTSSPSRIRRLLEHLEKRGLIVVREDYGGERSVTVPGLAALA
ncbi:ATP-binding protein [Croceibacterium ferulae]|uniref:ATP-binding protein n=1 Tax=Croceibacterium ferulae TaxID=1854641 RepID=UPI000EAC0EE3|nr:ATP-binding protein [Croceibacterium ferulae]